MNHDALLTKIGRLGDRLWRDQLSPNDANGKVIPLQEEPHDAWSLLFRLRLWLGIRPGRPTLGWLLYAIGLPLFAVIDVIQVFMRLLLYMPVLIVWWLEKQLAIGFGRYYYCPFCFQRMDEPLVFCPQPGCRRVQSRLKPMLLSLFFRRCPSCGVTQWKILGQRFSAVAGPFVCRHTARVSGCYRPNPVPALTGCCRATYIGFLGSTVRAKHSVMAHLFRHMIAGDVNRMAFEPAWELAQLEIQLCDQLLHRAFWQDTRHCEHQDDAIRWRRRLRCGRFAGNGSSPSTIFQAAGSNVSIC